MTDASQTLRLTLEIKVRNFTDEERREEMETSGLDDIDGDELADTDAYHLGEIVGGMFHDEAANEAFAGSNLFLKFDGEPTIVSAEWADAA